MKNMTVELCKLAISVSLMIATIVTSVYTFTDGEAFEPEPIPVPLAETTEKGIGTSTSKVVSGVVDEAVANSIAAVVCDSIECGVEAAKEEVSTQFTYKTTGWVDSNSGLNIRRSPTTKSKAIGSVGFGAKIKYSKTDKPNWLAVNVGGGFPGYVSAKYISNKEVLSGGKGISYPCSGDRRKSYMSWRTITSVSSPQYQLQTRFATTASNGIRTVNGRYCVAIGQSYGASVGTPIDVKLADGTIVPCIVADAKAYCDTMGGYGWQGRDGGIVEFVVETSALPSIARQMGSCDQISGLESPVVGITVYPDKNVL